MIGGGSVALNSDDRAEISRMIDARMDERSVHQEARMFLIDEETRRTVARIDTRLDGIDGRLDGLERTERAAAGHQPDGPRDPRSARRQLSQCASAVA